ncbi:MAG TPA: hypothetical protein VK484_02035 [Ferruginibacter sp.]|nr:hypothetical protein [Ferruginibacter sp.]
MKKLTIGLFCFFSLQHAHAQISDSTIKLFSKDICNCIDTLNRRAAKTHHLVDG